MAARIVLVLTLGILSVFHLSMTKVQTTCKKINGCHYCKYTMPKEDSCIVRRFCLSLGTTVCIKYHKEETRNCGIRQPVNYIVGGSPTNEGNWPWQVSLQTRYYFHKCGGVLIYNDWVLTAAHCVYNKLNVTDWIAVLGEFDLKRASGNEQFHEIKNIFVHPKFQSGGILPNDVALIQLENDSHSNEYVSPICLPTIGDFNSCSITGWGETKGTGDSSRLRVLNVTLMDVFECINLTWTNLHPRLHICVNYGQPGACIGDSGGPLSCARSDGRFFVEGVASWGSPSCRDLHYANIYTNIWEYVPWIYRIMSSN